MNWPVSLTIPVTLSYLLGSVPFALLLGKVKGIDIRQAGSRNIGATHLTRLAGRTWGVAAFLLDFLKGLLPVLVTRWLWPWADDDRKSRPGGQRGSSPAEPLMKSVASLKLDSDSDETLVLAALDSSEQERYRALKKEIFALKNIRQHRFPITSVLKEAGRAIEPSYLMIRGDYRQPGPRVRPAFPRIADLQPSKVEEPAEGASTSGLRSQLARWLTRSDHPLTGRVIVNRIWQHHFGGGLVETPSDLGLRGSRPSHPQLLDWLATELPRMGWSLKRIHRMILTSSAYLRSSRFDPSALPEDEREATLAAWTRMLEFDPENRLLARQNRRRLEAEPIRDALLSVSDRLSWRRGGRGVMPPLPPEIRKSISKDHWQVSPDVEDHHRRSVYLFVRRNLRYPFLEVFDRPMSNHSCARRSQTTIAPQCLALLNSDLAVQSARALAELVQAQCLGDEESQVRLAYRRPLGRNPSDEEAQLASRFLTALRPEDHDTGDANEPSGRSPLTAFCLSLLNLNEFVYVD